MANTIRLAVMGVTGAGKSTFIGTASGRDEIVIGHGLDSCTAIVEPFEFKHKNRTIQLFDTPGFNDTNRSEAAVLREIADWLDHSYREPPHHRLNGIIYLQSITDPRMLGSSLRNLMMFRELCGKDPLKHVVLVTTRWGNAAKTGDLEKANANEYKLRNSPVFWEPMIKKGSRVMKFEDTRESALSIIDAMIDLMPKTLQIQTELVDQAKNLKDTAAGSTVDAEIARLMKKHSEELHDSERKLRVAMKQRDDEYAESMRVEREKSEMALQQIQDDMRMLRYEKRQDQRRFENEMTATRAHLQKEIEKVVGAHKMSFDSTVNVLEANSRKLRPEAQHLLREELEVQKKKPLTERTVVKLLLALLPAVGSVVFSLIGLGPLSGFGGAGC